MLIFHFDTLLLKLIKTDVLFSDRGTSRKLYVTLVSIEILPLEEEEEN